MSRTQPGWRGSNEPGSQALRRLALAVAAAAAVLLEADPADAVEPPRHPVARAVYDFALTEYCGLVTPDVLRGFRRTYRDLVAAHALDEDEVRAARIEAWIKIEQEWSNRGLGGFRGWCRVEGARAVARFERYRLQAPHP